MKVEKEKKRYYVLKHPYRTVLKEFKYTSVLTRISLKKSVGEIIQNNDNDEERVDEIQINSGKSMRSDNLIHRFENVMNFSYNNDLFEKYQPFSQSNEAEVTLFKLKMVNKLFFGIENNDQSLQYLAKYKTNQKYSFFSKRKCEELNDRMIESENPFDFIKRIPLKEKIKIEREYYAGLKVSSIRLHQ